MTRTSAEIGAGLAAPRQARPIRAGERIHVVGVAGAGASAAAMLGRGAGALVSGCDRGGPSPYSHALEVAGVALDWEHHPRHVADGAHAIIDRLAVTKALTSVEPDHPELAAARSVGLVTEAWQQIVADAAATTGQRLVAVTGTHGKSTSAGWLVHLLVSAGRDPSAFVGALLPASLTDGVPATARVGAGDTFVVEADEYAGNFDAYRPEVAVLLNAEWDHPDVFTDETAVIDAFERWIRGAVDAGKATVLVANVGDPGVRRVVERLDGLRIRLVPVALAGQDGAAPHGSEVVGRLDGQRLDLSGLQDRPGPVALPLAGRHNAANAVLVAGAAAVLGVPGPAIAQGLASFGGVGRRMELKGEPGGITVLDDYGHHPTAIGATLAAVRTRFPGRPVWAVYEPLTYHRTAAMLDDFAEVLANAEHVVIADIWAGRDPDTTITSASALAEAVSQRAQERATAPGSAESTADHLSARVRAGDVVLVMGGGRSHVIAERLVELLSERSRSSR